MSSVCMDVPQDTADRYDTWQQATHAVAYQYGITARPWKTFAPERPVLRQEIFVMVARAADWAEKTGGCDPKPEACVLGK